MTQTISEYLQWHTKNVKEDAEWRVKNLTTRITVELLEESFKETRKGGAPGTDKVTWGDYDENRNSNLQDLHRRLREQKYRAPAVKRAWIPKEGGKRPLGIPTLEDKVVQRAAKMLLEPIYEAIFRDSSYGFRPGRSAHQAIAEIRKGIMDCNIRWILDADIRKCFDTINHTQLTELVKLRIEDGSMLKLIGKWLNAGVMDGLELSYPEAGTPQGGVISPLLANIYLHYVLDEWFEEVVKPRMKGNCFLVRYADDFVIGFEHEEDAKRVMEVLPKRTMKYGLAIHPEKTRLVDFRNPERLSEGKTFNFLGFTMYWSISRRGYRVVKKRTMGARKQRAIKRNQLWCKQNRHKSVKYQHERLSQKLQGYYSYFGVIGNYASIMAVYHWTKLAWMKWLGRRGGKKPITWEKFQRILDIFPLPKPHIIHVI